MNRSLQYLLAFTFLFLGFCSAAWASPRQRPVEGSVPVRVSPFDDGRVVLFPESAEFFGKEIRINPDNFCIAWWSESEDFVAWEMDLPAAGKYEVWIQWAIADDQAGNPFFVQIGDQKLTSKIAKSGGWTSFGHASMGVLELPAGKQRFEMHAEGELKGELADIRAITLNPVGSPPPPAAPDFPAKSPAASLSAIRLHPEMQVELVSCEPLVRDPIAIAWGADLKLWVVEMGDYPLGVNGEGSQGGRIKFLEDTNADGRYDKATLFLEGLSFPTGILPYGKGVLITCAPDIFYAEDTDGDGRADKQKVLFTGFPERNQQHRVNGLRWGFDNWIYCANGDGGVGGETSITSVITSEKLSLGTRDFRFRPETGEMEAQSGPTQFGRNQDNAGNWFGSNNGQPLYHFALDEHYLARNKRLAPPDPRVHMFNVGGPFYAKAPLIAFHGEQQTLTPATRPVGLGGACSGMIYRDELLGKAFSGNAFVCDPVTNLVHRRILTENGITFSSARAEDEPESEFFASTDPWTRPTMVQTGPDGALYLVDMYRLYIEHPQWINQSVLNRADLRAGNDRGRIYRIYPRDAKPRPTRALDKLSDVELVQALDSPSPWQRDTAQQRIVMGKNKETIGPLLKLLAESKRPATRLQVLGTIAGLGVEVKENKHLMLAFEDEDPSVRRWGVKFAEEYLNKSPKLAAAFVKLADDPDPKVVLQVAYSLGEWKNPQAEKLLAQLIAKHRDDPYFVTAALSSAPDHEADLLAEAFSIKEPLDDALLSRVIEACAAPGDKAFDEFIAQQLTLSTKQNGTARQFLLLAALLQASQNAAAESLQKLATPLLKRARELVSDDKAPEALRAVAMRNLAREQDRVASDIELLSDQLSPAVPLVVAEAALDRLSELDDPTIGMLLASRWAEFSPGLRIRAFDILLSRTDWTLTLLKQLEEEKQLANSLDTSRRQQLAKHPDEGVRTLAERVLGAAQDPDRLKIVSQYTAAFSPQGDAEQGRAVFKKNCSVCHRLENEGHVVGPDLTALKDKTPQSILEAVLNPNRAVEDKFMAYNAETVDGRVLSGLVQVETGNSITLAAAEGRTQTILRSQLEQLVSTGRSLMPDGFEKTIPPAAMNDLLAYLAQVGSSGAPVRTMPELVKPDAKGTILLLANQAGLRGQRVGLNPDAGCIAWMIEGDSAEWNIELPQAGEYEVHVEWAQIDELADNPFEIEAAKKKVTGKFASTHGWANYKTAKFGTFALPAGRVVLALRPNGMVKTELADVRMIKLVPR